MDNHPIPQDVTGFQFRLIGNMTVKQFVYVAVGAVGAVIVFYLPIFALIKIILIPVFIIAGVALAFLPIEGRPVDVMTMHFLKALFAPNQFVYHKEGGHLLLSTVRIDQKAATQAAVQPGKNTATSMSQEQREQLRQQQLAAYLSSIHQNQDADEQEASKISALFGSTPATPVAVAQEPTVTGTQQAPQVESTPSPEPVVTEAPVMTAPDTISTPQIQESAPAEAIQETSSVQDADLIIKIQKDTDKIAEDESLIQKAEEELTRAKAEEQNAMGNQTQSAHAKVLEMEQKLQALMDAKADLERELRSLKAEQTKKIVSTPDVTTVPVTPAAKTEPAMINNVSNPEPASPQKETPAPSNSAGFPSLPDVPNILLGVVRDSSGNVLPHILVEVRDQDENPVRAFKTNQLGQFLSATPLKEGTYTVHLEDAKNQYKFDVYPVTVNNQILPPLEIAAHDLREELRKSLFA